MESDMEQNNTTLEQLIKAARKEDWSFVDGHINNSHLTGEPINWALSAGLAHEDQNIRDLAATLLDRSDEPFNPTDIENLKRIMADDPYHIVRYRVAIALYKRGSRNPAVEQMMLEAENDPDVGGLASSYLV